LPTISKHDLHIHSTYSDGTFSPEQIMELGKKHSMVTLAITDHDCIDGVKHGIKAANEVGINFIPAVEIGSFAGERSIDLLGYFINPDHDPLIEALENYRKGREERIPRIISKLCELGIELPKEIISEIASSGTIGRPHVAIALTRAGFTKNIDDAFHRYLAKGKPAYVARVKMTTSQTIKMIKDSGGFAVWAHPALPNCDSNIEGLLEQLIDEGLEGLEVVYPYNKVSRKVPITILENERLSADFIKYANKYYLLKTGGSDFHGDNKANVSIGEVEIPDDWIEKIIDRVKK
jgi:3',5'-nucleoside bisphosphate phosphatase